MGRVVLATLSHPSGGSGDNVNRRWLCRLGRVRALVPGVENVPAVEKVEHEAVKENGVLMGREG